MRSTSLGLSLRQLTRSPLTALAIVANLAFGIGATTAIYALAHATLLAPLPYRAPDRLIAISARVEALQFDRMPLSEPELFDVEERSEALAWVAGFAPVEWTLSNEGQPRRVRGLLVTEGLFTGLGAPAERGRSLTPEDFEAGAGQVVLISHGLWREHLGADPDVVGREIVLDGRPTTVIGVMPPEFRMPHELSSPTPTEAWRPRPFHRDRLNPRAVRYLQAVGGLAPGVSLEEAAAEAEAITAGFQRELPQEYPEALGWSLRYLPLEEEVFGRAGSFLALLAGAALLVLSIACFNVTGLLLGRGEDRAVELAVRSALGGARRHLACLLAAESALLFGVGTALGLALAAPLLRLLGAVAPASLPRLDQVALGLESVGFSLALAAVLLLPFGILPAWRVSGLGRSGELVGRVRQGAVGRRSWAATAMVVGQVALAFAVTAGAALLVGSWLHLQRVDLGIEPAGVETFEISLDRYDQPEVVGSLLDRILERLQALPGVDAAGTIDRLPMTGAPDLLSFTPEGVTRPDGGPGGPQAVISVVGGDLLPALGVRMLETGRDAAKAWRGSNDRRRRSVVVNATLARRYFPGGDAVGSRLRIGSEEQWLEIVGVVRDVYMQGPEVPPEPQIFLPVERVLAGAGLDARAVRPFLVVRTDGTLTPNAVRRAIWELDPGIPINESRPLGRIVATATSRPRLGAFILALLAGVSGLLAATGVFALNHRAVARRRREIGIRIALGATRRSVFSGVFRRSLAMGAAGLVLGALLVYAIRRSLGAFLFGVTALDPGALALGGLLVILEVAAAAALPARRAARVLPDTAIRRE